MKVVLITGGSSGIGLATAIAAAKAGWKVVATTRSPQEEPGIDFVHLELTDGGSISECVGDVVARYGRLDALVNNAGVAGTNPTMELGNPDHLRAMMEVNFFGLIAMSRAAMPHLRAAQGHLVTISSVRGVIGQPFNEGYSAAKFAVEGFMEGLAPVAATVGVKVCLVEPAAVLDTEFVNSSPDPDVATLLAEAGPYEPAFRAYREWVQIGAIEGAQLSREVAEVVVRTIGEADPPLRIQTSDYARRYVARKLADPSGGSVREMTRSWVT